MRGFAISFALVLVACGSDGGGGTGDETDTGSATDSATDSASTTTSDGTSGGSTSGGSTSSASGTTDDSASGGSTTGGSGDGCGKDPGFTGSASSTIDVAGDSRSYVLWLPADYDPNTAYPLVFGWHGRGSNGQQASLYFGVAEASQGGAIFVYPDGLPQQDMGGQSGWDLGTNGVDVQLFDALRAELTANLCVDESRIFSTGHSFGGYFSNVLGCARADVLLGIAPVAGGGPYFGCGGGVAAWITHGMSDSTVPFAEGEGSRDFWRDANGCADTSAATTPDPCVAYDGCMAGMPLHWCPHNEGALGGHGWPTFAGQAIWDFFAAL